MSTPKKVTKGGLKKWKGGGRFHYETDFPQGLEVKLADKRTANGQNFYFLNDPKFFPDNTFERHDATYYGVCFDESEVVDG